MCRTNAKCEIGQRVKCKIKCEVDLAICALHEAINRLYTFNLRSAYEH